MLNWRKYKSLASVGVGLTLGLLVGVGMMIGALATSRGWVGQDAEDALAQQLSQNLLHATATDSGETFAMATGAIDGEIEGLFILDFLTGELQCFVLNSRTAKPSGWFKRNVVADLGVDATKAPKYLMVTGGANFRGSSGNARPAQCLCYVCDANTGNYAAYSFPWSQTAANVAAVQAAPMLLIASGKARNVELRE